MIRGYKEDTRKGSEDSAMPNQRGFPKDKMLYLSKKLAT